MANRLTYDAWIAHGFLVLKTEGHEALKADKMVKALGVTRGSFYWHFENIDTFHEGLMAIWRGQQVNAILSVLKQKTVKEGQLETLVARVVEIDHSLEAAMRRWAGADKNVAKIVSEIDRHRLRYMQHFFMRHGISHAGSEARASLLNLAFVGLALSTSIGQPANSERATHIAKMILKSE